MNNPHQNLDRQLTFLVERGIFSTTVAEGIKNATCEDIEKILNEMEDEIRASASKIKLDFIMKYT